MQSCQQQNPKGNGNGKGGGANNGNGNGKANAPGQNKGGETGSLALSTDDINYRYDAIGNLISDEKEGITRIEWNPYGKIRSVSKTDGTKLEFRYDVAGQRIEKKVGESVQRYVRDASEDRALKNL